MESAISSWDEKGMRMALTERVLENNRTAIGGSRLPMPATADEWVTEQSMVATTKESAESCQFLADELIALRRDYAKLQQAVFEAAQIQRRLCAPRELVWGEFEIAGEIFPVRHLSGDFFKLLELESALGLALGDIAGKGLSAGIWQAHVMGLMQRSARRHADPTAVVAEVNTELCQDQAEPPLTALFFAR